MMFTNRSHKCSTITSVGALVAIVLFIYSPGLSGTFHLDDAINLSRLGENGGIRSWEDLLVWVTSGTAGPTGRPLSLLSFTLNAQDWPTPPYAFIQTNILIHALNSALLLSISLIVIQHTAPARSLHQHRLFAALVCTSIWALHPFLVSTTLYVVQRMTLLSTTFVLLGIWGYLKGRQRLIRNPGTAAYLIMSLSIVVGSLLAVLSKESGGLLPLYILCIEATIFASSRPKLNIYWKTLIIYLPASTTLIYFILKWSSLADSYSNRPFTLTERVLTETRVIWDYLYSLFVPRSHYGGLYHDGFIVSESLTSPLTTLFSIVGLGLIILLAFLIRKRQPLIALSIIFFMAGHIMESTILPLELYYEHRNYAPSLLLFLPIAIPLYSASLSNIWRVTVFSLVGLLCLLTWQRTSLWGEPDRLRLTWAAKSPNSFRAQISAAKLYAQYGNTDAALKTINKAITDSPQNINLHLSRLNLRLHWGQYVETDFDILLDVLNNEPYYYPSLPALTQLTEFSLSETPLLPAASMIKLLNITAKNQAITHNSKVRHGIHYLLGRLYLASGKENIALAEFFSAYDANLSLVNAHKAITRFTHQKHNKLGERLMQHIDKKITEQNNSRINIKTSTEVTQYYNNTKIFRKKLSPIHK